VVLLQSGCVTVVTPPDPAGLQEPATVYLVDHQRHSSLMLPLDETAGGGLREYAYGEWAWFAENSTSALRVPAVLFVPTEGALGRADHPAVAGPEELRARNGFEAVHELRVEAADVRALLERLDLRFESRIDTLIVNPEVGLEFVKDDRAYSLANHCNHVTAGWLRELGVEVGPVAAVAEFRIQTATTSGDE
jgi:hypothetical protein